MQIIKRPKVKIYLLFYFLFLSTVDITALYDSVFWLGDLNFRIERQRHAVEGRVNQIASQKFPNFETLLGGDQLLKYMMEGQKL